MEQHHIFISYARSDGLLYAQRLETSLSKNGFNVWLDIRKIDPSKDFTAEIEQAIRDSRGVIVCVTKDTQRQDSFVRREIQYALLAKKPIIVGLFHEDVIPPIHIVNQTWIDFYSSWEESEIRLIKYLDNITEFSAPKLSTETTDPYRPYLEKLYDRIVDFLNRTVITLIDLESEHTQDAVDNSSHKKDMFDQVYISQGLAEDEYEPTLFRKFRNAVDHYHGRLLLLGNPGAGKSVTLMAYCRDLIADRLADHTRPVPFLGIIPTWDIQTEKSIPTWISEGYSELTSIMINEPLTAHSAIFLLDGLDELGSRAMKKVNEVDEATGKNKEVTKWVDPRKEFLDHLPLDTKVVITCRIKDYEEIGKRALLNGAVTLHALSDLQIIEYLGNDVDLGIAIENDRELREMLRTPLLMSLFAYAYRDQGEEAINLRNFRSSPGELRAEIIRTYVQKRYRWDSRKHFISFSYDEITTILRKLAFGNASMEIVRENVLTANDFAKLVDSNYIDDFTNLFARLHIIVSSDNTFRFIHLLVRDYFVYLEALPLLQSEDLSQRLMAANALGRIRDDRATTPLLNAISKTNARVREAIAAALIRMGEPSIPFLESQIHHPDSMVRRIVAEVLGHGNSRDIAYSLIEMKDDLDGIVRRNVAKSLGQIGNENSVPYLIEFLQDDDIGVQSAAVLSLGEILPQDSLEILLHHFTNSDSQVQLSIIKVFAKNTSPQLPRTMSYMLNDIMDNLDGRVFAALANWYRRSNDIGLEALNNIAQTATPFVKVFIIRCYRREDNIGFVSLMNSYLYDERSDKFGRKVSDVAFRALSKHGSSEAKRAIKLWQSSQKDE